MKLLTKRLGILGYGLEGRSLAQFLGDRKVRDLQIFDEHSTEYPDFTEALDRDVLLRSPGVSPHHPKLQTFAGKVLGTLELFLSLCPTKKIIGITGTKGKGTTATLLKNIFGEANDVCHLVGNIGTPFFDELPKMRSRDFVVAELSSFQLWDTELSPQIAVILGISPAHLDKHLDFEEYLEAKTNIFRHQRSGGRVAYFYDDQVTRELVEESVEAEQRWAFSLTTEVEQGCFVRDDIIIKGSDLLE